MYEEDEDDKGETDVEVMLPLFLPLLPPPCRRYSPGGFPAREPGGCRRRRLASWGLRE